jgi:hypothetical protein
VHAVVVLPPPPAHKAANNDCCCCSANDVVSARPQRWCRGPATWQLTGTIKPSMATRDWSTLPDAALVSILSAVQAYSRRLMCCTLVSRNWATAAVVATTDICLSNSTDSQTVHATLSSSYSSIKSLTIGSGPKQQLSDLPPLPGLQELQLLQTKVQLGPGCTTHGILHAVTALTYLLLHDVTLPDGLQAVSVLRSLRSLSIVNCMQPSCAEAGRLPGIPSTADGAGAAESLRPAPVPGGLFSQLLQLSALELRGGLSESSLQYISRLTNLERLGLDFEGSDASSAALCGLDRLQGLSYLTLIAADVAISSDTVLGLSSLSRLDALWPCNCRWALRDELLGVDAAGVGQCS